MIAYMDTPSGISGDMFLGCLLDAGWPVEELQAVVDGLGIASESWQIGAESVMRGALQATLANVQAAEESSHRHLGDIVEIIEGADLTDTVKAKAIAVFTRLAQAEADVHGMSVDHVHFHEVGAVDAIIDIVGVCAGLEALGISQLYAGALPLGPGWTNSAHGRIPLPAPATLKLLAAAGAPTRPAPGPGELVTPTGAALICELATFEQPPMAVQRIATGAGQKEFDWPNIARLWLGETLGSSPSPPSLGGTHGHSHTGHSHSAPLAPHTGGEHTHSEYAKGQSGHGHGHAPAQDWGAERDESFTSQDHPSKRHPSAQDGGDEGADLVQLETNIDDMNPELYGHVIDMLFDAGALDVWLTPIQMKKQRPGTLLAVLARAEDETCLADQILRETTTLGVRVHRLHRHAAGREQRIVETPLGPVHVKAKFIDGEAAGIAPEHDDCRKLAKTHNLPLQSIYEIVLLSASSISEHAHMHLGVHHD